MAAPLGGDAVAVGIDLASIEEVRRAVSEFGDRYLHKLFTAHELAECGRRPDPAPRLAACFAAKEAAFKALRLEGPQPPWTSIEVRSEEDGRCVLHLSGAAAQLAWDRGIDKLAVSLTHDGDMAGAVVVGSLREADPLVAGDPAPH